MKSLTHLPVILTLAAATALAAPEDVPQPVLSPPPQQPEITPPAETAPPSPTSPASAADHEAAAWVSGHWPTLDDWKFAVGAEAQWRRWFPSRWGFSLAVGFQRWAASAGDYTVADDHVLHPKLDGVASVVPVGASLLWRSAAPAAGRVPWGIELGVRYAWIGSDVTVTYEYINHYGQPTRIRDTVSLDGRPLVVARVEVGGRLGVRWEWFACAGYQYDFTRDENWLYEEIANDLGGATLGAGVRRRL